MRLCDFYALAIKLVGLLFTFSFFVSSFVTIPYAIAAYSPNLWLGAGVVLMTLAGYGAVIFVCFVYAEPLARKLAGARAENNINFGLSASELYLVVLKALGVYFIALGGSGLLASLGVLIVTQFASVEERLVGRILIQKVSINGFLLNIAHVLFGLAIITWPHWFKKLRSLRERAVI